MHFPGIFLMGAALVVASCVGSAFADDLLRGGNITCHGPFQLTDTRASLMARYKSEARVVTLADFRDEPVEGLQLFPKDPHSRLEIVELIGTAAHVTTIGIREKNSLWTMEGLRVGMTVQEVAKANGGRFALSGFPQMAGKESFGALAWMQHGNCSVLVVFRAPKGVRFNHPADESEVASDDPRLAPLRLRVVELSLSLPEQPIN